MNVSVHGFGKVGQPVCAVLANNGCTIYVDDPTLPKNNPVLFKPIPYEHPESPYHIRYEKRLEWPNPLRHFDLAPKGLEYSFIIVPTPSMEDGHFDHSSVIAAIERAKSKESQFIVVLSTLDPSHLDDVDPDVFYCPLMVALGDVYRGVQNPEYQLIGLTTPERTDSLKVMIPLQYKDTQYHTGSREYVAWQKLVVNVCLSFKISIFNRLWMNIPSSAELLTAIAKLDSRIGEWGSVPGRTPAGPCLPRDLRLLEACCGNDMKAFIQETVYQTNNNLVNWWLNKIENLDPKQVAVLGNNYKPGVPIEDDSIGSLVSDELLVDLITYSNGASDSELIERGVDVVADFYKQGVPEVRRLQ